MAKVKNPLLSSSASGSFADKFTFKSTRNGAVCAKYSYPGSVNGVLPSSAQLANRVKYQNSVAAWQLLSQSAKDNYNSLGSVEGISGWNFYLRESMLTPSGPSSGITWPANDQPGSDIMLIWSGADMLQRVPHTVIWDARYFQQTGYYGLMWHTQLTGFWEGTEFEFGTHPFPCDGNYNIDGEATGGTGDTGVDHYFEIAGIGVFDFIQKPDGPFQLVIDNTFLKQARTSYISGSQLMQRFYPDLVNNPTLYLEQGVSLAAYNALVLNNPGFTIGGSYWAGDNNINSEACGATLTRVAMFSDALTINDIISESNSYSSNAVTIAGQSSLWYVNSSLKPTDISDKSGNNHNPSWKNANRPTLYTP